MDANLWTSERARLNHDILCNQVLTEIASARVDPCEASLLRLTTWLRQAFAYRSFIDGTVDALDGAAFVDDRLFICWSIEQRSLFRGVFRRVFSLVNRVPERVRELHLLLSQCEEAAKDFLNMPKSQRTGAKVDALERSFERLSRAISDLPRPIVVCAASAKRSTL